MGRSKQLRGSATARVFGSFARIVGAYPFVDIVGNTTVKRTVSAFDKITHPTFRIRHHN